MRITCRYKSRKKTILAETVPDAVQAFKEWLWRVRENGG